MIGFSDTQLIMVCEATERVAYAQRNKFLRHVVSELSKHSLTHGERDISDVALTAAIAATLPRFEVRV